MKKIELYNTLNGNFKTETTLEISENVLTVTPIKTISDSKLISLLGMVYEYENFEVEKNIEKYEVFLNLKGLSIDLLITAFKFSLEYSELKNPTMLLNIINLIKIYNTLDDSFFENKEVYISSMEEFLDIKMSISVELKAFIKQLSIYFISLFKSYNKISYTSLDKHVKLPNIYAMMFLALDTMTLSGIFAISEPFSTEECVYIENSIYYMSNLLRKNVIGMEILNVFLKGIENESKSE